jgi:succinoglycan biosynthesis transport protein ExoP
MPGGFSEAVTKLTEYWTLFARHKWHLVLATLTLALICTVIIAKLPNVYEATTTILVDPQQVPEKYVSPVVSSDPYTRLNTITQQVLSRSRLQEIIDKFNLYPDRRSTLSPEEVVEEMRQDITIVVKQGSGPELSTFSLTYQGKQPELVATVANELAASFIHWSIASRVEQVAGTKDFLTSELIAAKRNLEMQENTLRGFKMNHLGETPDQTGNNLQAIVGLRAALQANADAMNRLDEQKILLTRSPEPPVTATSGVRVDLTPRERLEAEKRELEATVEQLREHYSDRYPDIVRGSRRLKEINTKLNSLPPDPIEQSTGASADKSDISVRSELIEREMKKLAADRDQIQSQIESYQEKLNAAPIREQQELELTRNYDTSKQHYLALLDKSFNIAMAADLEQNQKAERFRVLDPARVPEKPVKPPRRRLLLMAGVFAFGLSILGVVAKQELSPMVKTEAELKSLLPIGVRVWGFIPRIELASEARRARRWAIGASVACILLSVAIVGVILGIRQL